MLPSGIAKASGWVQRDHRFLVSRIPQEAENQVSGGWNSRPSSALGGMSSDVPSSMPAVRCSGRLLPRQVLFGELGKGNRTHWRIR